MENLNAEQVKKALECWASGKPCEGGVCDLFDVSTFTCDRWTGKNALALITSQEQRIGELAKENERLTRLANLRQRDLDNANDLLFKAEDEIERVRADTVREMQEEVKAQCRMLFNGVDVCMIVDQIAKEMLEGE